jgi:3-oxoacyl-[acyl-carrier-protein] synthase-1
VADPAIPPLALVKPEQRFAGIAGGEAMLSNSFAFGGSNVTLVLARSEAV